MSAGMVRASEVISPAPAGHFLRQFGQSDREIISSSTDEASISQALRLLNGEGLGWIMKPNSALNSALQNEGRNRRKMDIVFQSFFARPASPSEWELIGAPEEYGTRRVPPIASRVAKYPGVSVYPIGPLQITNRGRYL